MEIERTAFTRLEQMVPQMAKAEGVTESRRSDEMGGTDEQRPALGGGIDTERIDLQLTPQERERSDRDWLAEGVPEAQLNTESPEEADENRGVVRKWAAS